MQPSHLSANFNATVVIAEGMRRRASRSTSSRWTGDAVTAPQQQGRGRPPKPAMPGNRGGWNLFVTVATALDASTPLTNVYLATPCPNDVAGFPCDEDLQHLRRSWWESIDEAERAPRRPDPGEGVPGRAVHQRRAVEAVHGGCGRTCRGWGRRRCRCSARWRRRGDNERLSARLKAGHDGASAALLSLHDLPQDHSFEPGSFRGGGKEDAPGGVTAAPP